MGCCSGRATGFVNNTENFKIAYESRPKVNYDSIHSISDPNLSALVKLKEEGNIAELIASINDDTPISEDLEVNHPWAVPPKSKGSAACMFLVLMLIQEDSLTKPFENLSYEELQKMLNEINVLEKVRNNLTMGSQDRVELTVLMLMFMVDESEFIKRYLQENKVYHEIFPFLFKKSWKFDHSSGLRIAALQYLKVLYTRNKEFREEFIKSGGPEEIIDIFNEKNDSVVFECLNAIDELTFSELNDTLRDSETIKKLAKIGIYDSLIELNHFYDSELKKEDISLVHEKFEVKKNIKTYLFFMKLEFEKYLNETETKTE